MSIITAALLQAGGASAANAALYAGPLAASCARRGVTAPSDVANLLAEIFNESGDLAVAHELMSYSTAARIVAVFPSHFPGGVRQALPYVRNPVALGDYVYAKLGGFAARGTGLAELTGIANFRAYAADVGHPAATIGDYMATPEGAADSAVWYFVHFGCRGLDDPRLVRCRWAGQPSGSSPIGLPNVLRLYALFSRLLAAAPGGRQGPPPVSGDSTVATTDSLNDASAAGTLDV